MTSRTILLGLLAALICALPASARQWKPTLQQQIQDYATIDHNKPNGHVIIRWLAAPSVPSPILQPVLDKYVVLTVSRFHFDVGSQAWDDVTGVQVSDGNGTALKEVPQNEVPPALVGLIATSDAAARQVTQGKAKTLWLVLEAGNVHACGPGKLLIAYDGETYNYDTPMPGCGKQ